MFTVASRCIAVQVAGALWGLPVDQVQEVIGMRPLTRVFHAPEAIVGVTSLRGDVLTVLDLAVLLGARPSVGGLTEGRIVVVRERDGAGRSAGLCVEELRGLRDFPESGLAALPSTLVEPARDVAVGIIPSPPPCAVLSVSALLDSRSIRAMAARDA